MAALVLVVAGTVSACGGDSHDDEAGEGEGEGGEGEGGEGEGGEGEGGEGEGGEGEGGEGEGEGEGEPDLCGNGNLDPGETCDDDNQISGDGCRRDCLSEEICGDGNLDASAGEQCDDGDTEDGPTCSADCLSDKSCGNGVLDEGEACDDGNHLAGDSCSPDCSGDESCGNDVIDFAIGELCDDGPKGSASCSTECQPIGCGDGATTDPETCDDSNTTRWDGCGPDCRTEQSVIFDTLELIETGGCDFNGDGAPDNAFGQALQDVLVLFNDQIAGAIDDGTLMAMFDFLNLDDATGQDDPAIYLSFYQGADSDDDPGNNFEGGAELLINPAALDAATCDPVGALGGDITGGDLVAGPEDLALQFPLQQGQDPVHFDIRDAIISGSVAAQGQRIDTIDDGQICGGVAAGTLAAIQNPAGIGPPTILDVLVVGIDFFGITVTPTQPDIDFDRDGLENFEDTDGDDSIDLCYDGDGTPIQGEDCVFDPAIRDGYSIALGYTAIWDRIIGIADPGCTPAP